MKNEEYCIEGYKALAAAVVSKAVQDYRLALRELYRRPHNRDAQHTKKEYEIFFRRDIGLYSDLDGEAIIKAVRERVEKEMRR